jgi:glutaconyl-CoA/methylmalonyl-CoA decarboxylase subunit gamma
MIYKVKISDRLFEVEITDLSTRPVVAVVDGERIEVWPEPEGGTGTSPAVRTAGLPSQAADPQARQVLAPMPGVIVAVAARTGSQVTTGQELCTLEAMKMRNVIRAPRPATIGQVHVVIGQSVKHRDVLVEFEE